MNTHTTGSFEWFVHPLGVEEFFDEVWEKKPMVLRWPERREQCSQILDVSGMEVLVKNAMEDREFGEVLTFKNMVQTDGNPFETYLGGGSVVVNHACKNWEPINRVCSLLTSHLPHVFANVYLTPPTSAAVPPHSDDRDVFVLQVWGSKQWRVWGSPIAFPYTDEQFGKKNAVPVSAVSDSELTLHDTLEMGDVMYIPRGYIHAAQTTQLPSLHVTFAIPTHDWTWGGVMCDVMLKALRHASISRQSIPPNMLLQQNRTPENEAKWSEHLQNLVSIAVKSVSVESVRENLASRGRHHTSLSHHSLSRLSQPPHPHKPTCMLDTRLMRMEGVDLIVPSSPMHVRPSDGAVMCVFQKGSGESHMRYWMPSKCVGAVQRLWNDGQCVVNEFGGMEMDDLSKLWLGVVLVGIGVAKPDDVK